MKRAVSKNWDEFQAPGAKVGVFHQDGIVACVPNTNAQYNGIRARIIGKHHHVRRTAAPAAVKDVFMNCRDRTIGVGASVVKILLGLCFLKN